MVIHQAPASLSTRGYGQSNTHSHIVAVRSLQLPPLRIPAIKLAPGTFFFLVFGGTSASLPIRAESLLFCPNPRIYFFGNLAWGIDLYSAIFLFGWSKTAAWKMRVEAHLSHSFSSHFQQGFWSKHEEPVWAVQLCVSLFVLSVNMSCSRVFSSSLGSPEADCRVQTTAQSGQKSPITVLPQCTKVAFRARQWDILNLHWDIDSVLLLHLHVECVSILTLWLLCGDSDCEANLD